MTSNKHAGSQVKLHNFHRGRNGHARLQTHLHFYCNSYVLSMKCYIQPRLDTKPVPAERIARLTMTLMFT